MLDFSELSLNTSEPVYAQINEFIKRQIFLGKVKKGEPLPSRREMATLLKINPNTAQRAFRALEDAGLVLTPKNTVSILYFDEELLLDIQREMTADIVAEFVKKLKENKLSLDEVMGLLQQEWEKGAKE
ncbi:HTH-type transcriptional repressor YtrA [Anaerotignum neopropionicum]|uniref:HTH-type transcriptional repressor YtrA n=1 Tax=Anaerotignum neopropionicum TaxID=36847 RepID=A0A136WAZ7_9FIRM|nr:GntR family transcriptional regulator [Anaerotignum neopropionicum]KXL51690.1 HTH-type transcriptional repressor YtrA [Anaerotignum neopropionicum]